MGLVICLDSGCATYDTLWLTTSLRGLAGGVLDVRIVGEGLHSGSASGVVPSTFRIVRQLLDRIEDAVTGRVLLRSATVDVPGHRVAEAEATAARLGPDAVEAVPWLPGARPMVDDPAQALLARTWRPALSYIGQEGIAGHRVGRQRAAAPDRAGAVVADPAHGRPPARSRTSCGATLEADPPYGAQVSFRPAEAAPGWSAPDLQPWLRDALEAASTSQFGQSMQLYGEGGTIPFMGMLGERFPEAQFVITGVLGPGSNAHGPNEFLDVAYAQKLTCLPGPGPGRRRPGGLTGRDSTGRARSDNLATGTARGPRPLDRSRRRSGTNRDGKDCDGQRRGDGGRAVRPGGGGDRLVERHR